MKDLEAFAGRAQGLHQHLAASHPKLKRGQVWCHKCGRTMAVHTARCFAHGWPVCCQETMSIDSPEERAKP